MQGPMRGTDSGAISSEHGLRLVSNKELNDKARKEAEDRQQAPIIIGLSSYLEKAWQAAKEAKEQVDARLVKCLRQRKGMYSPEELAVIRQTGGSEIYMMLTAQKCRAVKALIRDVILQPGEKPWGMEHTPIPDLPPHIEQNIRAQLQNEILLATQAAGKPIPPEAINAAMANMHDSVKLAMEEQAKYAAERMEMKIADQLEEGKFNDTLDEFIDDYVTYPAAFLYAPILRNKKSLKWQEIDGRFVPKVGRSVVMDTERVSPFDVFPSSDAKSLQDGYLFLKRKLRIGALNDMKGMPGYDSGAIDEVIQTYGRGGLREWLAHDYERSVAEGRPYEYLNPSSTIDSLFFWGDAPGFMLLEWGVEESKIPDLSANYHINAIKIGRWIIRAAINPHPLGWRPVYSASFDGTPGTIWGESLPEAIADDAAMCNGAGRALANNMGIASGPQVVYNDISRMATGESVTNLYPWKIHQFNGDDYANSHRPPMEFFQPNALTEELMAVMEKFSAMADKHSGIPAYSSEGMAASDAGKTASGLSMLLSQSSKGVKLLISNIDKPIKQVVEYYYVHNMLFDEDPTCKGDLRVIPKGSTALLVKEQQQMRRLEFSKNTNNPVDFGLMGPVARLKLLRSVAQSLDMPDLIPDPDEMANRNQNAAALTGPGMPAQPNAGQIQPAAQQPQTLDNAGAPVSGQDTALFNQNTTPGGK